MKKIKIKEVCETCIKRKTMYCPNSSKCYSTENKPYYQNGVMLLEENRQLQNNWNELKEWLKFEIDDGRSEENLWLMGCYDETKRILGKMQEIEERK